MRLHNVELNHRLEHGESVAGDHGAKPLGVVVVVEFRGSQVQQVVRFEVVRTGDRTFKDEEG